MEEDQLIPLSYISQYAYCARRAELLMLEQQWSDSTDTVKGSAEHENVHTASANARNGMVLLTDLPVTSRAMHLLGKCDAVEATICEDGVRLPFLDDKRYALYPIEYKHGLLRNEPEYELQLCAQAMCLEEQYGCTIPAGALFYISSHRRKSVVFSDAQRRTVQQIAAALAERLQTQQIEPAIFSAKCAKCSLKDICLPQTASSVGAYLTQAANDVQRECVK